MSAYVVSDKHIVTLLVGVNALRYKPTSQEMLQRQANMLMRENVRSVNYRYNERSRIPRVTFRPEDVALATVNYKPADFVALANCVDYQSCERPDYDVSPAKALLDELRVVAYEVMVGQDG